MSDQRELIDTGADNDVAKSLSQDAQRHSTTKKPRNQGDKGD